MDGQGKCNISKYTVTCSILINNNYVFIVTRLAAISTSEIILKCEYLMRIDFRSTHAHTTAVRYIPGNKNIVLLSYSM